MSDPLRGDCGTYALALAELHKTKNPIIVIFLGAPVDLSDNDAEALRELDASESDFVHVAVKIGSTLYDAEGVFTNEKAGKEYGAAVSTEFSYNKNKARIGTVIRNNTNFTNDWQAWYRKLKTKRNPDNWTRIGEWWIDDSGTALYADQDVGDMGHEAYVIDSLTRRLLDGCGVDCCDEHAGNLYDKENKKLITAQMKEEEFDGTIEEFVEDAAKRIWKDPKQREDALRICEGNGDARKYGMQYDGWIRVAGHGFECWNLTPTVLKHMGDGIYDAGVEDVGDDEIFEIYVHNTGMHYTDVPWSVINGGDPGALRVYGTKNNPAPHAPVMSYAAAHRWETLAKSKGVSQVARSERGFMRAYQRAGTWARLDPWWKARRNAFVARHMAQGRHEKLWKPTKSGGLTPSRRALALLMWAYMPPKR